jgi:hypothetical protein
MTQPTPATQPSLTDLLAGVIDLARRLAPTSPRPVHRAVRARLRG